MILVFQAIQTYVVDSFTLHAASGECISCDAFQPTNGSFSPCRCLMFAFARWLRLSSLCTDHVRKARIWKGQHHHCCCGYSVGMSCVSSASAYCQLSNEWLILILISTDRFCYGSTARKYA